LVFFERLKIQPKKKKREIYAVALGVVSLGCAVYGTNMHSKFFFIGNPKGIRVLLDMVYRLILLLIGSARPLL